METKEQIKASPAMSAAARIMQRYETTGLGRASTDDLADIIESGFAEMVQAGREAALLCGEAEWCLTCVADEMDNDGPYSKSVFWRDKAALIQAGLDKARASGLLPHIPSK